MTIHTNNRVPCFDAGQLEGIARVLGDTATGLSETQIGALLADARIPDTDPTMTKWKRLFNALVNFQNEHKVGNGVIVLIHRAMNISRYTNNWESFHIRQSELNKVLAISGYELRDDGKLYSVSKAKNLDEAILRANRLKNELERRNVHTDILKYCNAELVKENYFHAVLEAVKSITAKIRILSGYSDDDSDLVVKVFAGASPQFVINAFDTGTLQGEQRGFVSLLKGLYGTIRNPLAHEPKIEWQMSEQDALDIFSLISLIHRKLDQAKKL